MAKREIPVLFQKREECCGCGACRNICPQDAIQMKEDSFGVAYPQIHPEKCVRCGKCAEICRFHSPEPAANVPLLTLAASAMERDIRMHSSSGGIFTVLAQSVLEKGGMVYGASFTEDKSVAHIMINQPGQLARLRGSKYVQSDTGFTFREVKKLLRSGKQVLYSGTPCQIDALYCVLGNRDDNLLTVDLVCHGVPGSGIFREYLKELETREQKTVAQFLFRDKSLGWGANGSVLLSGSDGKIKHLPLWCSATSYYYYYLGGWISRPSCYHCKYACSRRPADITLGDYWGIERAHPECLGKGGWNETEGVSVVIANTEKGKQALSDIQRRIRYQISAFEKAAAGNAQLRETAHLSEQDMAKRERILERYVAEGWHGLEELFPADAGWRRYRSQIKALIPPGLKRFAKRLKAGKGYGKIYPPPPAKFINISDCKVSVIIPVYNTANFLEQCIRSVCTQSHNNLEIILIDDGSTDGSSRICDRFAENDSRIIVVHQKNSGVSAARNAGIDLSSGEYVCFVDSDDFVMPDYVEYLLYSAVKNNAQIALTTGIFGNFQKRQVSHDSIYLLSGEDAVENILCYRIAIGVYNKIFRRDFLGNDVRFIPRLFMGEGFQFNIMAFQKATQIVSGSRCIYYYRRDNLNSATSRFSKEKCECGLYALKEIKRNLTIHSPRIERAWEYANWRTHSDFYDRIVLSKAQKEEPELFQRCLTVVKRDFPTALKVPVSGKDRLRAVAMGICPRLIPLAMIIRNHLYHIRQ